MPTIHPTACVDSQARLADDVQIGPGCVLEGCVTLGPGTRLVGHVWLKGPLTLGARNLLYPNVCVGLEPQDRKFDPNHAGAGVRIGDDNILREGVTIHRATHAQPTTLGSRCYLMVNSHMAHDCMVGDGVILANGALLAGHVVVEDNVILSGNAVVHQFCRVGRMAMMSGVQGVTQDIPPFCVVYSDRSIGSLNIVGLRRAGLRQHIKPLQTAFDIFFKESHANAQALTRIEHMVGHDPLCRAFVEFIRKTKRGICPYHSHLSPEAAGTDD